MRLAGISNKRGVLTCLGPIFLGHVMMLVPLYAMCNLHCQRQSKDIGAQVGHTKGTQW